MIERIMDLLGWDVRLVPSAGCGGPDHPPCADATEFDRLWSLPGFPCWYYIREQAWWKVLYHGIKFSTKTWLFGPPTKC